jgi:hypothetical protein
VTGVTDGPGHWRVTVTVTCQRDMKAVTGAVSETRIDSPAYLDSAGGPRPRRGRARRGGPGRAGPGRGTYGPSLAYLLN